MTHFTSSIGGFSAIALHPRGVELNGRQPIASLVAGPLADRVFEPLLAVNGPLAGSVGQITGVGPGRGIGLLLVSMGLLLVMASVVSYLYPRLRLVDEEVPDAMAADPATVESGSPVVNVAAD